MGLSNRLLNFMNGRVQKCLCLSLCTADRKGCKGLSQIFFQLKCLIEQCFSSHRTIEIIL